MFQPVGPDPAHIECPTCHASVKTSVERKPTTRTHLLALVLCLFLCWPCVCIPYCTDSCQNVNHYCPKCKAFLGTYDA